MDILKKNLDAAYVMYFERIKVLKREVEETVQRAERLGEGYYEKIAESNLNKIEEEIDSVMECIEVLDHLTGR